ncbi:MAG: thiamine-phosphate kinase [Chloroflexota bacterium]
MKVSETGEFGLIDLLGKAVSRSSNPDHLSQKRLVVGIGDDAAAWKGDVSLQLATTDTMVEGVHFIPGTFQWEELGWKAMAANLSDIAAMGGSPLYALVSLSLPDSSEVEAVLSLFRGMLDMGSKYGVAVVGGNISSAPVMVITITLLGRLKGQAMLLRSTARPGDRVAVTGHLGASAAAVAMFRETLHPDPETSALLRQAHFHPEPRVAEGQALLKLGVRTAIDISDGLVSDLTHVCEASSVGARVLASDVPVHPAVRAACGPDSLRFALGGGEDFELLFTASNEIVERARATLPVPVTVVGDIVSEHAGKVAVYGKDGKKLTPKTTGWDHFRK